VVRSELPTKEDQVERQTAVTMYGATSGLRLGKGYTGQVWM
jgi:hypothetical protein